MKIDFEDTKEYFKDMLGTMATLFLIMSPIIIFIILSKIFKF